MLTDTLEKTTRTLEAYELYLEKLKIEKEYNDKEIDEEITKTTVIIADLNIRKRIQSIDSE